MINLPTQDHLHSSKGPSDPGREDINNKNMGWNHIGAHLLIGFELGTRGLKESLPTPSLAMGKKWLSFKGNQPPGKREKAHNATHKSGETL